MGSGVSDGAIQPPSPTAISSASSPTVTTYLLRDEIATMFPNYRMAVSDPYGKRLYVTYWYQDVVAIDAELAVVEGVLTTIHRPDKLTLSADGSRLYVSSNILGGHQQGSISIVDTDTLTVLSTFPYPHNADHMAVGPLNKLHIASGNSIQTMDLTSGAITNVLTLTGTPLGFVSYDDQLYISQLTYTGGGMVFSLLYYDISTGVPILSASIPTESTGPLSVGANGSTLLLRGSFGIIYQFDAHSLELRRTYGEDMEEGFITSAIAPNSAYFVGRYKHRCEQIPSAWALKGFDLESGELRRTYIDRGDNWGDFHHYVSIFADGDVANLYYNGVRFLIPADHALALPIILHSHCVAPFIDDFSDPSSGWPVADTGSVIYRYLQNEYNIYHRDTDRWAGASRGDVWNQSRYLEVEGRIAHETGAWGLLFGVNEDWSDFFVFEISPHDQHWFVLHFEASEGWQLISYGQSHLIQPGNAPNTLALSTQSTPNFLTFVINGTPFWNIYITDRVGLVGLSGASFAAATDIRYHTYTFVDQGCPLPGESDAAFEFISVSRPDIRVLIEQFEADLSQTD